MNKRKIILILVVVLALLALSGCTVPTKDGQTVLIDDSTTFKYMFDNEGFFAALFVFPLVKSINFIASSTGSVFLGVVLVAVTLNVLVTLFTLKQNIAQQKMQELQPELAKIQKKYEGKKDNASKMRQGQEMQELYKKEGINPLSAMLSAFIPFPIMIAMYHAVVRSSQVSKGSFLGLSLDTKPLDGTVNGNYGYLIIFIVMIILQLVSMKLPQFLNEQKAKKQAQQQHKPYRKQPQPGQNMMYVMVFIVAYFGITLPSAMAIYWSVTSVIMIVKTLVLNKYIRRG